MRYGIEGILNIARVILSANNNPRDCSG